MAPTLTFFVCLQPFDQNDEFTIEIAWSDDGRFPYNARSAGSDAANDTRYRLRLPRLFCQTTREQLWKVTLAETEKERHQRLQRLLMGDVDEWLFEPPLNQLVQRAKDLADDAVQKLTEHAVPLFLRVIEHRGLPLPGQSLAGNP